MVKIKGATAQDKQEIAAARAANKADSKAQAAPKTAKPKASAKSADKAPEAKPTKAEQTRAAEKLFKDADQEARSGLPLGITREQHENLVRKAALGF